MELEFVIFLNDETTRERGQFVQIHTNTDIYPNEHCKLESYKVINITYPLVITQFYELIGINDLISGQNHSGENLIIKTNAPKFSNLHI